MAYRFAVANGNWSSGATWDSGSVPSSSDIVYANGFNVTIDQDIDISSMRTILSPVYLPNMCVPLMTANNQPEGLANASTNSSDAYKVFDMNSSTSWYSSTNNTGWISYQFASPKTIKRYYLDRPSGGGAPNNPKDWNFEASNDGTNWTVIESVSGNSSATYLSNILTGNTNAYSYYRLNILSTNTSSYPPAMESFEMTESTGNTYGTSASGTFTVTTNRNLNFNGDGIQTFSNTNTLIINPPLSSTTVNLTSSGGGVILGTNCQQGTNDLRIISVNAACTVNYTGDMYGTRNASVVYNRTGHFYIAGNGVTLNVIGNLYGVQVQNAAYGIAPLIYTNGSSATINVTGNIYGATNIATNTGIYAAGANGVINVTGNIVTSYGNCIQLVSSTSLNHVGSCQVTSSNVIPAIIQTVNTGTITMTSPILNYDQMNAVTAYKMRFYSNSGVEWRFQNTSNNNVTLYSTNATGSTLGLPSTTNVRSGITFGASNELTGSLVVPLPSNVRVGVPTDNTVGTAQLTAEDFLNAISGSTNPVAVRLRNVATVDSVGGQIAAFTP